MRSRASIKSHPIHPILIGFPIAFFTGTLVFDVLAAFTGNTSFRQTASYLLAAGIISAVLAAIPGLIDFRYTVPPDSSARKRAGKHALLNSTMLLLFIADWFLRDDIDQLYVLMMEVAGVLIMGFAGWLGGTLVYRNQIGVDPRYANAGKWSEEYLQDVGGTLVVATADELEVNQMKLLHINDKRIVLCKTEQGYAAFHDRCTHKGASLAGGAMICGTVQCPWHGSQFDVLSGEVKAGPACEKIAVYKTYVEGGKVFLEI